MRIIVKQKIFLFTVLAILAAIVFFLNKFGIAGNSDTQLGVNIKNILHNGFLIWQTSNSGGEYVFPSLVPMLFQSLFNFFNSTFSNLGFVAAILIATVFITYKLVCSLLGIKSGTDKITVLIVSFFSINNDYVANSIITNSTAIWTFFGFISSLYLFFLYRRQKKIIYLILLICLISLVFMDFHMALLAIVFISSFLVVEFFYNWLTGGGIDAGPIKELALILLFLVLINSYWIINNAGEIFFSQEDSLYGRYVNNQNNTNAVRDAVGGFISPSFNLILSQTKELDDSFFNKADLLGSYFILAVLFLGFFFWKKERNKNVKKIITILFIQYIIFFSLSLGNKNPLGIFDFFWNYFPPSRLFRDFFKFNRLEILLLIILISYSLVRLFSAKKILFKPVFMLVSLFIFIKFIPYYNNYNQYKPYKIPDYYYNFFEFTKSNKLQDKIQIMPVISWYQGYTWSNQDYDMQEPIGYFSKKPLFVNSATYEENKEEKLNKKISKLLQENESKYLDSLLSIRNTRYLLLRNDLQEKYAEKYKIDVEKLKNSLDGNKKLTLIKKIGEFYLYSLKDEYFLPHFYVPQNIIASKRSEEELPRIFSQDDYKISSAVFFTNQSNEGNEYLKKMDYGLDKNYSKPVLEIKKINSTKYRIRIHKARDSFPLIFSEKFDKKWSVYLTENKKLKDKIEVSNYKILDENKREQASNEEVTNFIKNGWVTTLGDGKTKEIFHKRWVDMEEKTDYVEKYNIDFISKNFQGTIQNDNLPDGNIFETWFKDPIDNNENHLMANSYANSWIINPDKICSNNDKCLKNSDGTYDFEIVAEFWPQRLFYAGLFISISTFLASMIFLIYNCKKCTNQIKNG